MEDKLLLEFSSMWQRQSSYIWVLDPGHGGLTKDGRYTTAPAKMHKFGIGLSQVTIYEGVINRMITGLVEKALMAKRIDYAIVADDVADTSLEQRVRMADSIYAKDKRAIYLSIHSNAAPVAGSGSGWEIFTYFQGDGESKSKKIATVFEQFYRTMGKSFKFRGLKEANLYVLRKTDCPAILVENLFFDNEEEAKYLLTAAGQQAIADIIIAAIVACEAEKPI